MKKVFIKILVFSFALLTLLSMSGCAIHIGGIGVAQPDPYIVSFDEITTNYTAEEHKEKIYQRAVEIAEAIEYDGQILYDIIYDFPSDQPRCFIVEFDEVVEIYVGIDKRYKKEIKDDYIYTRIIYGTIINDEYYISAYGLGYDLEEYGKNMSGLKLKSEWSEKAKRLSTPPSIYTLLDVWDCKKYYYNLYEKDNVIYHGKYELKEEEWLYTIYTNKFYAKIYQAITEPMKEVWVENYRGETYPRLDKLEMNYAYNTGNPYKHATKLDQAYIFKVYEKIN